MRDARSNYRAERRSNLKIFAGEFEGCLQSAGFPLNTQKYLWEVRKSLVSSLVEGATRLRGGRQGLICLGCWWRISVSHLAVPNWLFSESSRLQVPEWTVYCLWTKNIWSTTTTNIQLAHSVSELSGLLEFKNKSWEYYINMFHDISETPTSSMQKIPEKHFPPILFPCPVLIRNKKYKIIWKHKK